MYANMLNQVGREYGGCMLVVENNSIGYTVLDKLIEQTNLNGRLHKLISDKDTSIYDLTRDVRDLKHEILTNKKISNKWW